jgi:hypothetical protein
MPVITCPTCGYSANAPEQFLGKRVKCKRCAEHFAAKALAPVGGGPPAEAEEIADAFAGLPVTAPPVRVESGPLHEDEGDNEAGASGSRRDWYQEREPWFYRVLASWAWVVLVLGIAGAIFVLLGSLMFGVGMAKTLGAGTVVLVAVAVFWVAVEVVIVLVCVAGILIYVDIGRNIRRTRIAAESTANRRRADL